MKLFSFIFLTGLIAIGLKATSQTDILFSYDSSGNRTERIIDLNKSTRIVGTADTNQEEVLTDKIADKIIKVYPNPTKGEIRIEIPSIENDLGGTIEIVDLKGQMVFRQNNITASNLINITNIVDGFYFLRLKVEGNILEWKIVKH